MIKDRYIHKAVTKDLEEKMVFIGGPRQVGKTTLSRLIGTSDFGDYGYFNWDSRSDRQQILSGGFSAGHELLIFDELHKYKNWKQYLKGLYDTEKEQFTILVTGSARLDVYRRTGDSLLGRYHYYRLHPFSVAELNGFANSNTLVPHKPLVFKDPGKSNELLERLIEFGGFPEPFVKADLVTLRRWQNERIDSLIKEDVRDLESLRDLSSLQILAELLPSKVGSLFSLNALREELDVAHKTMALWTEVLERLYYHYRIYPFTTHLARTLKKEPKLYLWDWSEVPSAAARFDNVVASHLLKLVHFLHDAQGFKTELFYLRDSWGHEVDFIITENKKPWFAVEVKMADTEVSPHLHYYGERLKIPYLYQVVKTPGVHISNKGVQIISADRFLDALV